MTNILIVDNEPYVRELLMEELVDEGYLVEVTGDAESVNKLLTSSKPDLVLLDLYMNGKDRWDVLCDIKRQYPCLPILLLTAYDGYGNDPRLSHADGYVIKSSDFSELKQKIKIVMEGRMRFLKTTTHERVKETDPLIQMGAKTKHISLNLAKLFRRKCS